MAELAEAPIMFAVTILAARFVVGRLSLPATRATRLSVGLAGLGLLLFAEAISVLWLQRTTIEEYFASRDPVAGTVYILLLVIFAIMPLLVTR
jgi:hypothetical protein